MWDHMPKCMLTGSFQGSQVYYNLFKWSPAWTLSSGWLFRIGHCAKQWVTGLFAGGGRWFRLLLTSTLSKFYVAAWPEMRASDAWLHLFCLFFYFFISKTKRRKLCSTDSCSNKANMEGNDVSNGSVRISVSRITLNFFVQGATCYSDSYLQCCSEHCSMAIQRKTFRHFTQTIRDLPLSMSSTHSRTCWDLCLVHQLMLT